MDNEKNTVSEVEYVSREEVARLVTQAKNKGMLKGFLITFIIAIVSLIAYVGFSLVRMIGDGSLYANTLGSVGSTVLDRETIDKINNIYKIIENTYIEDVDPEVIREGIYQGMLEALDDPYSVYYPQSDYKEMMESTSGTFEGIGAYLTQNPDTNVITVVRPIKDSPAEKVGILVDDILVEVDGEDITGQDLNLVVSKVRGEKGSTVNIGVMRGESPDIIRFDVVRDKINEQSVDYKLLDDSIGYIFISEFADATDQQFNDAYDELIQQGMTSLIIDMRSNGGGYVDTSVKIGDRLIKEGNIVSIKDKHNLGYRYDDAGDDKYMDIPCVVLVDGNTASASEILTGALKDHNIATIIGTQTFGKGIVQNIIPLPDGSGLKVTNSKYFTPNGENIHGTGIEPDIIVEWDKDKYIDKGIDNQLEAAKEYLTKGSVTKD